MRKNRINRADTCYHIYNRGNSKKIIFKNDVDRNCFMHIFSEYVRKYKITVFAFVLMDNHFHLLVKPQLNTLSAFMHDLSSKYASAFNRAHGTSGHVFGSRFKAELVETGLYLRNVSTYIHLNPVNTKYTEDLPIEEKVKMLNHYKYNSLYYYFNPNAAAKLDYLDCDEVLNFYSQKASERISEYEEWILEKASLEGEEIKTIAFGDMKSGRILGSETFAEEISKEVVAKKGINPSTKTITAVTLEQIEEILVKVGFNRENLHTNCKHHNIERNIAINISVDLSLGKSSVTQIGKFFGGIGVSATSQISHKVQEIIAKNKEICNIVLILEEGLITRNYERLKYLDISSLSQ